MDVMYIINVVVSVLTVGLALGMVVMLVVVRHTHSYHAPKDKDYIEGAVRNDKGTFAFSERAGVYSGNSSWLLKHLQSKQGRWY